MLSNQNRDREEASLQIYLPPKVLMRCRDFERGLILRGEKEQPVFADLLCRTNAATISGQFLLRKARSVQLHHQVFCQLLFYNPIQEERK